MYALQGPAHSDEEDECDDAFEPSHQARKFRLSKRRYLGSPITEDRQMVALNPIHQSVVDDFLNIAKGKSQKIVMANSLSRVPFTDVMLREMAISFPQNDQDLLRIPGIDQERVKLYGRIFLKLIRDAHQGYEEMMQQKEDRPQDPNHLNVINISSDDELGGKELLDDLDGEEDSQGERSTYFPQNPDVENFNAQSTLCENAAVLSVH